MERIEQSTAYFLVTHLLTQNYLEECAAPTSINEFICYQNGDVLYSSALEDKFKMDCELIGEKRNKFLELLPSLTPFIEQDSDAPVFEEENHHQSMRMKVFNFSKKCTTSVVASFPAAEAYHLIKQVWEELAHSQLESVNGKIFN